MIKRIFSREKNLLCSAVIFCFLGTGVVVQAADPPIVIDLLSRTSSATPEKQGFAHTGGGNIDVSQSTADILTINMTGVAVCGAHPTKNSLASWDFTLTQEIDIHPTKKGNQKISVSLEGKLIGLLRSKGGKGLVEVSCPGHATLYKDETALLDLTFPGFSVNNGDNKSINERRGPTSVVIAPGKYTIRQQFGLRASHPKKLIPYKAVSAEFAPDPALDPLWISAWEPFHGASKKDFGFQTILKVSPE